MERLTRVARHEIAPQHHSVATALLSRMSVGSAANSCAWVAMGRLTGYYEETGFVDTAAGILFVQEAGGIVTDWWGRGPDVYERTGCLLVANPATHAYLLDKLKDVPMKDAVHKKSVA